MNQSSYQSNAISKPGRRVLVLERKNVSDSIIPLDKKLQTLQTKAAAGDYQSQMRLEAVSKLLNPCFEFYESDMQRILNKGYSLQVERGLRLYRLMSRLKLFCEPIGDTVGIAARIRLINFEELTWDRLLDIKEASNLVHRVSHRSAKGEEFTGLDLLSSEEKALYDRLKPYFGGRKRPSLKSLAINILGEEEDYYSERNASNYLAAVKNFKQQHKDDLGFAWYFMAAIESYNRNPKTVREYLNDVYISVRQAFKPVNSLLLSRDALLAAMGMSNAFLDSLRSIKEILSQMVAPCVAAYNSALIGASTTFMKQLRSDLFAQIQLPPNLSRKKPVP